MKTPANPTGDVDFVPVLSFPQDIAIYAAPNESALTNIKELGNAVQVLEQYQSAFPELKLNAGVPLVEQTVAADTSNVANPFHMQLGLSNPAPGAAPGGNGGIYTLVERLRRPPGMQFRSRRLDPGSTEPRLSHVAPHRSRQAG